MTARQIIGRGRKQAQGEREAREEVSLPRLESHSAFLELLSAGRIWRGEGGGQATTQTTVPFDVPEIDAALPAGGLALQAIHELTFSAPEISRNRKRWVAPCFIPSLLVARRAQHSKAGLTLWIGRRCFPSPHVLEDVRRFLPSWDWRKRCFFIDPTDKEQRLWSIVESLRARGVVAVVADGSFLPFSATRRLQLAASESRALFLLIRPPWEIEQPSVAQTKWRVSAEIGLPRGERGFLFSLELLRARGLGEGMRWTCEWRSGRYGSKNFVVVPSAARDGAGTERAKEERRARG